MIKRIPIDVPENYHELQMTEDERFSLLHLKDAVGRGLNYFLAKELGIEDSDKSSHDELEENLASRNFPLYRRDISVLQERVFSLDELKLVAEGSHPTFQKDKKKSLNNRLDQAFAGLLTKDVQPSFVVNFWENLLEENEGDIILALAEFIFRSPDHE